MGRDKALIEIGGVPLAGRVRGALLAAGAAETLAVGGDARALAALGFRPVADGPYAGSGPLGGIIRALEEASHAIVVVFSCDLPFVGAEVAGGLHDVLAGSDVAVAVAVGGGEPQPLLAAWRRDAAADLRAAYAAGERSPRAVLGSLATVAVVLGDERAAIDVDTPADLDDLAADLDRLADPGPT
jgi:molybdopterin-guanine dinucleotide biosynthesis protein A